MRTTRTLVTVAVAAALSAALSYLRIIEMPQGGSVTLDMVPILYVALWRGPGIGISAGALAGLLQLLLHPFIVHPIQVLLDYPLAMAACGLAGFFRSFDNERALRSGLAVVIGTLAVAIAGMQWFELERISDSSSIILSRKDGFRTVLNTEPDTTFGDIEARMVTIRERGDAGRDTIDTETAHGDVARRWLDEAMNTVRTRQLGWLGTTLVLLAALGGLALVARYLPVSGVSIGVLVAGAVKFGLHFLSGAVFFGAYAPAGESVWIYSAAYNAAYMIPQTLLALLLLPPLLRRVRTQEAA